MREVAFSVDNVGFAYGVSGKSAPLFEALNIKIFPGSITAIMGPSGSGKSTLGKLLAGELVAQAGKITFGPGYEKQIDLLLCRSEPRPRVLPLEVLGGEPAAAPHAAQVANGPVSRCGWNAEAINARVGDLMNEMDLVPLSRRFPAFLSGGQRSRLALARVLSWRPRSLILDEYLADLDVVTRGRVIDALRKQVRDHEMTIVMISHDPADVSIIADRCLVLGGAPARIVADIDLTAKETKSDAQLQQLIHQSLRAQLVTS